jgi:hypothetical protein
MPRIPGSCLCGSVRFAVTEPFTSASHCHCSRCRKESGAFGLTNARVPRSAVRVLAGKELIRVWAPPDGDETTVRLGALDADPGIRPQYHSYVGSRAPWEELPDDGLPRHEGQRGSAK